ncbi:hypothetical protein ABH926_009657 [Catenulispora sp. GP43]|uniref:hypothetical protein n=1 Tax=Catenulispora sp. GP43 TaxID=3156263 RepID=UPI0035126F70
MATHTADLRVQRRRVEHIRQMTAQIADREHIIVQLMTTVIRAGYYFLTLACLTAGLIGLVRNRHALAVTWGVAGIALVLLWVLVKVSQRVMNRVVRELRKEFAKSRPGRAVVPGTGTGPGTVPTIDPAIDPGKPQS